MKETQNLEISLFGSAKRILITHENGNSIEILVPLYGEGINVTSSSLNSSLQATTKAGNQLHIKTVKN